MKKVLRWIGIILVAIIAVLVLLVGGLYINGGRKLAGPYQADPAALELPSDEVSLARGERISNAISGCASCHGSDLGGKLFLEQPGLFSLYAPNLTSGAGGVGSTYTTEDWLRALRYGIGENGRALAFMPSQHYSRMSEADMGGLLAYLATVAPVENETPQPEFSFIATVLIGAGQLPLPVDLITEEPVPLDVAEGITAEYGEYFATIAICEDCHTADYTGNTNPNAGPVAPDLTQSGELVGWSFEDFSTTMKAGITPTGRQLSDEMPWVYYQFTDEELEAVWLFLQTMP